MPQVKVISPPQPKVDSVQYYDEAGVLQTVEGTVFLAEKNGIRFIVELSPTYSSRVNQWQNIQFEYSTDSGVTWEVIPVGTLSASVRDSADTGKPSAISTTYTTILTLDFYGAVRAFGQATQVRVKITDIAGIVWTQVIATYNVARLNMSAFTLQHTESFDRNIYRKIDWDYLNLLNEETFDRLIYKS